MKSDKREVYVTGDIGCYTLDVFPGREMPDEPPPCYGLRDRSGCGLGTTWKVWARAADHLHLRRLDLLSIRQFPALINAVYNKSNLIHIVLDNEATAMTGFQAHPGVGYNAVGEPAVQVDIEGLCRSLGIKVAVTDPFDIKGSTKKIRELLNMEGGVRVLIMKRACELLRAKRTEDKKPAK